MKRTVLVLAGALLATGQADAATISLFECALNIDSAISAPNCSAIADGSGSLSVSVSGVGAHYIGGFFDFEIDEDTNTFFNEYGSSSGSPSAGQAWEIDEPGYSYGDIYANFLAGTLDGSNGVPATTPDDVSMALAWNFVLAAGQTGYVDFVFSLIRPNSGFYLAHTDPDSGVSIYLSSTLDIRDGGPVPEPGSLLLLGTGLLGLAAARRRHRIARNTN